MPTERATEPSSEQRLDAMRIELTRTRQALRLARIEIETLRQARTAAEQQVARTRNMLSFRLGHLLIHGFKSWRGLRALPRRLLDLWREARRRRRLDPSPWFALPNPTDAPQAEEPGDTYVPPLLELPPGDGKAEQLRALVVASILDEFTEAAFRDECRLLSLAPDRWRAQLEAQMPHLLLVESAWFGADGSWKGKINHVANELLEVVEWCRERRVPSLFWNKEDPVHFETFLTAARLFDHVFTTDIDCIHRYKGRLGHDRVYLLPFACQPRIHNPIASRERKRGTFFAGGYYVRYPERGRDLASLLDALASLGPVDIYDRHYGQNDPRYRFPEEYRSFIVGNLSSEEVVEAYKGYEIALNLNSIKQSQSMFARRIFELLACNTLVVSNYSRGLRLLFGDLVFATDSGDEVVRRIRQLRDDPGLAERLRLVSLRRVMADHTCQDRFAYLVSKLTGSPIADLLPQVVVTGYARTPEHLASLTAAVTRQEYHRVRLVVVLAPGFVPPAKDLPPSGVVRLVPADLAGTLQLGDVLGDSELLAGICPQDYHGPSYLLDLVLATRYSGARVIGKAAHYEAEDGNLRLVHAEQQYQFVNELPARAALIRGAAVANLNLAEWAQSLESRWLGGGDPGGALAIDPWSYCREGGRGWAARAADEKLAVSDSEFATGLPMWTLQRTAEGIPAEVLGQLDCPELDGHGLARLFGQRVAHPCSLSVSGHELVIESWLEQAAHEYLYAVQDFTPQELGFTGQALFRLEASPGLQVEPVLQFFDGQRRRLGTTLQSANQNHAVSLPPDTAWVRLALRLRGPGTARVRRWLLGHRPSEPALVLGQSDTLVLSNNYPAAQDLYRNAFVHSRVLAYARHGVRADVFRLRPDEPLAFHEHEGVDVITGPAPALRRLLAGRQYRRVFVHFLNEAMWRVLSEFAGLPICVWLHGAEISSWRRRRFNYSTEEDLEQARVDSERRLSFWRKLLRPWPQNLRLVVVSRHFADEVMEDLGFELPEQCYTVINNPIDTCRFQYYPKPAEQRRRILLIRPFASRQYANDLAASAILALRDEPFFHELEFRIVGSGPLFDEVTGPLRALANVTFDQRFLTQAEIASLHRSYGLFLCPTRWDSQGVSRDEAMASGLVPLTNDVAAVREFVDDRCAIVAPPEDHRALAAGISRLYREPDLFLAMSRAAAERVRQRSALERVIAAELTWNPQPRGAHLASPREKQQLQHGQIHQAIRPTAKRNEPDQSPDRG